MLIRRRKPILLTAFVVCCVLLLYTISSKVKNKAIEKTISKVPERRVREEDETHSNLFKLYDGVETFIMFIGYPRSSHTLMASLLDAHPEIIIPNEYDLTLRLHKYRTTDVKYKYLEKYALFYFLHKLSTDQASFGLRSEHNLINAGKHIYSYQVSGLWQGSYDTKIKVIGDKKGGGTSDRLTNPDNMAVLDEIHQIVKVPMKFIHVTRNPFDNIATMLLERMFARVVVMKDEGRKVNRSEVMDRVINNYFNLAEANVRVKQRYGEAVIDIPGHELVLKPRQTLQKLCDHLNVTCSEDYFEKCSKVIHGTPSVTRDKVVWTAEQKARVEERMKKYTFLQGYSYEEQF